MGPNKGHCYNTWDSKPSRPSFQSLLATQHLQIRELMQGLFRSQWPWVPSSPPEAVENTFNSPRLPSITEQQHHTPQSGYLVLITQGCLGTASPALPGTRQRTETCITSLRKNHTQNPDHPDDQPVENPQVKMSPVAEGSPLCRQKPQPGKE